MKCVELFEQEGEAVAQLLRRRFVLRRRAARRGCNDTVPQPHTVGHVPRVGLRSEPRSVQRRIEKIARGIAREHSSGAVTAMCSGRETNEHYARARIAE